MALSLSARQLEIDRENSTFWDELCGSATAEAIGVVDRSPASLEKFDHWYLAFYPYLKSYIPFDHLVGQAVLEVGLGYGTIATALMSSNARYHGLDIASGPVEMARYRADLLGRKADIRQGSILDCPFNDDTFDHVVSIGCLHHTGDLGRAIAEVRRVLKPGGGATIMVYNALSYRQWLTRPIATLGHALRIGDPSQSWIHIPEDRPLDTNQVGEAAPETAFVTRAQLRALCTGFDQIRIRREHVHAEYLFKRIPRSIALRVFGPWLGLNLYCTLRKSI